MPNYKSKMLTFLSLGEMSSMLLDNTDEDGILFAVATDATNFKIVMWRKNSTATVDNDLVYPANGPGRWHVLANGSLAKLADVNVLNPTTGQALVFNGTKWVNQTIAVGEMNIPELMVYDDTLGSATPPNGAKLAVVNKVSGDELYVAKNDTWELLDIAGGDDTIAFADLPTGTTSNTVAIGNHSHPAPSLDNLSDVIITSPANGNVVAFNGTNWVNQAPVTPATNLDGLSDVVITSPASGQTLSFNGTNWINAVASTGAAGVGVTYYEVNIDENEQLSFSLPAPDDATKFSLAIVTMYGGTYDVNTYLFFCYVPGVGYIRLSNSMRDVNEYSFSLANGHASSYIGEIRGRDWLVNAGVNLENQVSGNGSETRFYIYSGWEWIALLTNESATGISPGPYTKVVVNKAGLVTAGYQLAAADIPSLATSKITSGTFDIGRIPTGTTSTTVSLGNHNHTFSTLTGVSLSSPVSGQVLGFNGTNWTNVASGGGTGTITLTGDITGTGTGTLATTLANTGTAGTYTKVTTDAKGRVVSGTTLISTDIPSLDTGKITTGIFDVTRIPDLSTSKITSGVFDISFIPTGTTPTTVALGNHNHTFNSLSGINITTPSNGQILSFDNATGEWKNTTLPAGTGAVNSVDGYFGDVILTNTYQAKSNELTAIAGLDDSVGYIKKTGDGVYVLDNNISGAVASVDGLTGAVSLTNSYQAKSNELTAIAGLADTVGFIKKTADGVYTIEDITGGSGAVNSVDGLTGDVILSSNYLALTGGTVSGVTSFSSSTPSTSTTTGAVKITDGGLGVTGSGYFGGDLSHNGIFRKNGVGSEGWVAISGISDKFTTLDTSTMTLSQVAERLKAIQDALSSLGILSSSGDPYAANVSLHLKGDGVNGSTSIIDSSPIPKTLTVTGNTMISNAESKYGGSSIFFDGTGDSLTMPVHSDLSLSDDFTIEAFVFATSISDRSIFSFDVASGLYISNKLILWKDGIGSIFGSNTTNCPLNTWFHFAIVRSGTTASLFQNGILISTGSLSGLIDVRGGKIGAREYSSNFIGYIDSFRITKGVARYLSNFNPETATYLNL